MSNQSSRSAASMSFLASRNKPLPSLPDLEIKMQSRKEKQVATGRSLRKLKKSPPRDRDVPNSEEIFSSRRIIASSSTDSIVTAHLKTSLGMRTMPSLLSISSYILDTPIPSPTDSEFSDDLFSISIPSAVSLPNSISSREIQEQGGFAIFSPSMRDGEWS